MGGFGESCELEEVAHRSARRTGAENSSPIKPAVIVGGPENPFHVVLRFRKRNVVDELVLVESGALGDPLRNPGLTGVIARQRIVGCRRIDPSDL